MAVDKNMPIIVAEDNGTMQKIIKNLLNQLGFHNIRQAMDGGEAIQVLKAGTAALIISDWNMEPVTGLDFLKSVRADPATKDITFIMLTGESKMENVVVAKQAGVSNYIVKPFNLATFKQKLVTVIGDFN